MGFLYSNMNQELNSGFHGLMPGAKDLHKNCRPLAHVLSEPDFLS